LEHVEHYLFNHPDGREEIRSQTGAVVAVAVDAVMVGSFVSPPDRMIVVRTTPPGEQPAWMPAARAWLKGEVARVEESCGSVLAVWPRACDVISDVPSTLAFLREHPNWRLVLEPQALLTRDMLPMGEDHLARIVGALAGHAATVGVVLGAGALAQVEERLVRGELRPGAWVVRRNQRCTLSAPHEDP
jgi:hypothetical protein